MKIDEPKTPYTYHSDSECEEGATERVRRVSLSEHKDGLDPQKLSDRLQNNTAGDPRCTTMHSESEEDESETEEQRAKRKAFELKRKKHYNEFQAVKLAKQLLQDDDEKDKPSGSNLSKTESLPSDNGIDKNATVTDMSMS